MLVECLAHSKWSSSGSHCHPMWLAGEGYKLDYTPQELEVTGETHWPFEGLSE